MSGGSFNYLCNKAPADVLIGSGLDDLQAMARALEARDDGAKVAAATRAVIADARMAMQHLSARMNQLREVWKSMEWFCSGDWCDERLRKAIAAYPAVPATHGAEALRCAEWLEHIAAGGEVVEIEGLARSAAAELRDLLKERNAPAATPTLDFCLVTHLQRQRAFSLRTFGPGERLQGVLDHIRKELVEVEESGGALAEWVDVVLLALDGAWRSGNEPEQVAAAIGAKQAKNEARTWPDWRTVEPGKAIEHVRKEGGITSSVKKWTAMCSQCGPVEIIQKTKPKSCKTSIKVSSYGSTRRCGLPLEQQREVA